MIDRYSTKQMREIWDLENKFLAYLEVEKLACKAWHKLGVIPKVDLAKIMELNKIDLQRIEELEKDLRHDVIAFTRSLSENLGEEKKWIHYGLTSTDVVDTAYGYLYKQANTLIEEALINLLTTIKEIAIRYKDVPTIGRTHGIHAEITTFGLKFALYYDEGIRHLKTFKDARQTIEIGKISGAVGTFANAPSFIQDEVCKELGINSANISTQVLSRDRHAYYYGVIALIGSFLEKIATEIRHLQRTEVNEVREGFGAKQKGSSAMPHKRNPIGCENICGLSRNLRGNMIASYENINLWHERDISHSSSERILSMDSTSLIEYMLIRMNGILTKLEVDSQQMLRNINGTYGVIFSQRFVLKLVEKGMSREEAYDLVQKQALKAWSERIQFKDLMKQQEFVVDNLAEEDIEDCFDFRYQLKEVDNIYERVGIK